MKGTSKRRPSAPQDRTLRALRKRIDDLQRQGAADAEAARATGNARREEIEQARMHAEIDVEAARRELSDIFCFATTLFARRDGARWLPVLREVMGAPSPMFPGRAITPDEARAIFAAGRRAEEALRQSMQTGGTVMLRPGSVNAMTEAPRNLCATEGKPKA